MCPTTARGSLHQHSMPALKRSLLLVTFMLFSSWLLPLNYFKRVRQITRNGRGSYSHNASWNLHAFPIQAVHPTALLSAFLYMPEEERRLTFRCLYSSLTLWRLEVVISSIRKFPRKLRSWSEHLGLNISPKPLHWRKQSQIEYTVVKTGQFHQLSTTTAMVRSKKEKPAKKSAIHDVVTRDYTIRIIPLSCSL